MLYYVIYVSHCEHHWFIRFQVLTEGTQCSLRWFFRRDQIHFCWLHILHTTFCPICKVKSTNARKKNLLYWYIHFCWQNVHCGHIKHHLNHLFRTIYILHCLNPSVFDWYSPFLSNSSMWVFPTFFCRSFSGNGLSTSMLQIFKHSYRMGPPRYNGV